MDDGAVRRGGGPPSRWDGVQPPVQVGQRRGGRGDGAVAVEQRLEERRTGEPVEDEVRTSDPVNRRRREAVRPDVRHDGPGCSPRAWSMTMPRTMITGGLLSP
ncbi:hypothetical protein DY240_08375 [Jiangella rhizosphaerae]|uniref:Uncharacterized protein n=1 Tax=Jiangella rhizosphaerae TaxID=2293569 RepID=A0A418KTQ7_9ACTN|nr:hypothetical protein DY240_08375 [Jiangella rhizosphaerae]